MAAIDRVEDPTARFLAALKRADEENKSARLRLGRLCYSARQVAERLERFACKHGLRALIDAGQLSPVVVPRRLVVTTEGAIVAGKQPIALDDYFARGEVDALCRDLSAERVQRGVASSQSLLLDFVDSAISLARRSG